ncbi:hypothetical protein [Paracoccus salsus]|uniref:hypothetical protein n=1 Tax=Paracoccus salsus TaxID=2911061 RepID=UPI001F377407|nr:hypothetical protein [Paracoccus salsus]MCF3973207.1 hypothetical protein [Paracoccus salsus]
MFRGDLADEEEAISCYTRAAMHVAELGDIGARALFETIVLDEEGRQGWLDLQRDLIERLGEKTCSAKLVAFGDDDD